MLLDPNHRLLRPLWVRLVIVALPFLWSIFEFSQGAMVWAVLFGALGAWLFHTLIMRAGPQ
ncbi:MAG: hypothetical protein Q4G25_08120 [Paracoccus sp. (in: a-proteobacteria)]|nr:hypothetical protein [Paracoccus sp. (in: a-proteobacteria)]